jgi:hypothetical protein
MRYVRNPDDPKRAIIRGWKALFEVVGKNHCTVYVDRPSSTRTGYQTIRKKDARAVFQIRTFQACAMKYASRASCATSIASEKVLSAKFCCTLDENFVQPSLCNMS